MQQPHSEQTGSPSDAGLTVRAPLASSCADLRRRGSPTVATLYANLGGRGDVWIANALLAVLDDPNVQPVHFVLDGRMFKQVAPRLGERGLRRILDHRLAVGRLQRTLPNVLACVKNRPFRNTWDYIDGNKPNENVNRCPVPGTGR